MKLMKHITIALVLCAIPAMAFGQTVSCEDCTHELSYYMGEGGFVATAGEDAKMVTYVATCGGITRTGELTPNDDGVVAMLFNMDNNLACHSASVDDDGVTKNRLQVGPVMDGGWYWITDDMNSAVGNLVAQDVLDNEAVKLTGAGEGVSMAMGMGAVFMKETSSGRVGILPNILPEPPMDPAAVCGPRRSLSWPYPYTGQQTRSCMLGGGRTKIRLQGPGAYGGSSMITTGMVTRPTSGSITVLADLWVDESGSYSTDTSGDAGAPSAASIRKGWAGKTAAGQPDHGQNWLTATFVASVGGVAGTQDVITSGNPVAGVDVANAGDTVRSGVTGRTANGQAELTIAANSTFCPAKGTQTPATITIAATPGTNAIHPSVAVGRAAGLGTQTALQGFAAITQLQVVCAPQSAASNHQGRNLVPDNPFPVDE